MKIVTKHISNRACHGCHTQAFCRPLLSAVLFRKLTIYRRATHSCIILTHYTMHVFARKQYILGSVLRHKSYLTLYLMLHRFEIHSALELSRTALLDFIRLFKALLYFNFADLVVPVKLGRDGQNMASFCE